MGRALSVAASPPTPHTEPLLVVVLGPTASGKTALALSLARQFNGEIVNCDSVAMYREFEIGTAKPSASERAEIRHHLLDFVNPLADVTAGEYARLAREILLKIVSRQKMPIVSGGTGLYLRALLEGLFSGSPADADVRPVNSGDGNPDGSSRGGAARNEDLRRRLRHRLEKRGVEYLHSILRRLDAEAARRIHANDVPKVIRAIEVSLAAARPMTELWQQGRDPLQGFRILRLGLNPEREVLYARINQRAEEMFARGLIGETEGLRAKYGEEARPLSSLGYKQALQLLRGEIDRESAVRAAQQAHRNYAKRQMTWFRREPEVHWYSGFGDDPAIQREAIDMVKQHHDQAERPC